MRVNGTLKVKVLEKTYTEDVSSSMIMSPYPSVMMTYLFMSSRSAQAQRVLGGDVTYVCNEDDLPDVAEPGDGEAGDEGREACAQGVRKHPD